MHFLRVWIIELALTELTTERDDLAVVTLDFFNVIMANGLNIFLLGQTRNSNLLMHIHNHISEILEFKTV